MALPEAEGPTIIKQHKVWVPIKDNPEVSIYVYFKSMTCASGEKVNVCKCVYYISKKKIIMADLLFFSIISWAEF